MQGWGLVVAAFFAAWLGSQLLIIAIATINFLRTAIWPMRVCRDENLAATPSILTRAQQAALEEIHELGFELAWLGYQDRGPRSVPGAFLLYKDHKAFAWISMQPSPYTGYMVAFYGFDAQGRLLITCNRIKWAILTSDPQMPVFDAGASNLAAHWQAHQQHWSQAQQIDPESAREAVWARLESEFDRMKDARIIAPSGAAWHMRLVPAMRTALSWFRLRRRLSAPYQSAVTTGEHRADFFVERYEETERQIAGRSARPDLKATVLVFSLVASLALWGMVFDWPRAIALVAILLIHEFGHAIAMRAFGWKDLSMFFVPFLGAIVTGKPSEAPAWKQAIILFAGPLPGLLAGVGILVWQAQAPGPATAGIWRDVAIMAISINLFNLLPVTPLDGGRLVEIALFGRWPRLRSVFAIASFGAFIALALWVRSTALWVIVGILALGLRAQWRVGQLRAAWREGLPREQQLRHLFDVVEKRLRIRGFERQWALVRSVFAHRLILRPRTLESVLTLVLLVAVWAVPAGYVLHARGVGAVRPYESRTQAQLRFDAAMVDTEDDEFGEQDLQELRLSAQALAPDDPRQVDLQVAQAYATAESGRLEQLGKIIKAGKDGIRWSLDELIRSELYRLYLQVAELAPAERLRRLRAGIEWAEQAAPAALAPTFAVRLRVAEAIDDGGDPQGALAMLLDLDRRAQQAADRCCELREVRSALVWYHLSHDAPAQAIALLQQSQAVHGEGSSGAGGSLDYAWALLLGGQTGPGLAQMRSAAYVRSRPLGWFERLTGRVDPPGYLGAPLDLAFALRRAGLADEAKAVGGAKRNWQCLSILQSDGKFYEAVMPWQRIRDRMILDTAREVCPAQAGTVAAGAGNVSPVAGQ